MFYFHGSVNFFIFCYFCNLSIPPVNATMLQRVAGIFLFPLQVVI